MSLVVNLFGAPCSGKSCGAAYIFSLLKTAGINCELVTEFAKDLVWEENQTGLSCQEYIFGNQSYRLSRLNERAAVIVTDSPLPLSCFYNKNPFLDENFDKVVMKVFNSYDNLNYLVTRVGDYSGAGRIHSKEEADKIGDDLQDFLDSHDIPYYQGVGEIVFYNSIVEDVLNELQKQEEFMNKVTKRGMGLRNE